MTAVDRLIAVRVSEFAHGMTRLAMRRSLRAFVTQTIFGLALLLSAAYFAVLIATRGAEIDLTFDPVGWLFVFAVAWVAIFVPWTRMRLLALFLKVVRSGALVPYRMTSFGPGTMSVTSEIGDSTIVFGRFEERFETASVFVLARKNTSIGALIPKRVFADEAELAAFRAAFFAGSVATSEALHVMSEPIAENSIRYVLTPAEHRRGMRHLALRTAMGRIVVLVLLLVLGNFAYQIAKIASDSPPLATFLIVFIGAFVMLGIRRFDERLRALLSEVSFAFDDEGLRFRSSSGSLDFAWSEVRGLVEDELVLVLRMPRGVGLVVPKRALETLTLATIRTRVMSSEASPG